VLPSLNIKLLVGVLFCLFSLHQCKLRLDFIEFIVQLYFGAVMQHYVYVALFHVSNDTLENKPIQKQGFRVTVSQYNEETGPSRACPGIPVV